MLTANNAFGFATRNKVQGLQQLNEDRRIVFQSFEMDIEDNPDSGFELLAKRLSASALYVWKQCNGFKREKIAVNPMVKHLRAGERGDIAWLKPTENEMLQSNGKVLVNNPPSWKKALIGSVSSKKPILKALDTEFNNLGSKEYPKMQKRSDGKWIVLKDETHGKILSNITEAIELYQSFGGKVVIK